MSSRATIANRAHSDSVGTERGASTRARLAVSRATKPWRSPPTRRGAPAVPGTAGQGGAGHVDVPGRGVNHEGWRASSWPPPRKVPCVTQRGCWGARR